MTVHDHDDRLDELAMTARWTAAERARESAREDRLFLDPMAEALAGHEGHDLAERMRASGLFDASNLALRTRFYDDALLDAVVTRGVARQVVSLASGMDSRAIRLPLPEDLTWFELDRPELLALKNSILADLGATPQCRRRTVAVDLTTDWTPTLEVAGFDPDSPTVWLVEGLIFYLGPTDVESLFDRINALSAAGSEVLVDTVSRSLLESPEVRPWCDLMAGLGIPWRFGSDDPAGDLFSPRGWQATAMPYVAVADRVGREHASTRRSTSVPPAFLVHARR